MADIQLYVRYPDTTGFELLELFAEEPIKLQFGVQNIIDPLQVSSTFSRSFRVPHTGTNGPFFRAVFNVNSFSFDASRKADAYINENGAFFSIGNIRLSSVFRNEATKNIEYEIIFYGETSDFGSRIGGGFLSEVSLTPYNHIQNYANITNSWTGGLFGGDVIYPLCEWGYTYTAGVPDTATLAVDGLKGFVGASPEPLEQGQFKPVLRAKALWDAIFLESGYSYSSEFLEGIEFTDLYIVAESTARALLVPDQTVEAVNAEQSITTGSPAFIEAVTVVSDPGNCYDPLTGIYTAKLGGSHSFSVNATQYAPPGAYTWVWILRLEDADTGSVLQGMAPAGASPGYNAPFTKNYTVSLATGQRVRFKYLPTAPGSPKVTKLLNLTLQCTSAPETVVMSSLMPTNIKKIDFIRSIINKFRLVFEPSNVNPREFTITPWKNWIISGTQYDWTAKLDAGKDMKITPLFYGQERFQVYRELEDADFVNLNYGLVTKQTYGQLNLDTGNELITGARETVTSFAPTPLFPIGNADASAAPSAEFYASRFLIPHFAKDTNTERNPIQPKLRLLYYNGVIPVPDVSVEYDILNDSNNPVTQSVYPLISEYSTWPPTTSTFDLSWENEAPLYEVALSGNPPARTGYDTFSVYWKAWYETTFDPYSRIVEANFVLAYEDIYNLKFNDYVFVIDAWYIVNKITDYVVGQSSNVRVQLIKVGNNIGLTIPPSVTEFLPVQLCRGTSACEAFCCNGEYGYATYYVDGTDLSDSAFVYQDPYGSLPAPEYILSDGVTTVQLGPGGVIVSVFDTSECDCVPEEVFEFVTCYATVEEGLCIACCCSGDSVTVYGTDSVFLNNVTLYLDSGLTSPASDGAYYESGTNVAIVGGGFGNIYEIGTCDNCECEAPELFPLEARFYSDEIEECVACNGNDPVVNVFGDGATWGTSLFVYDNNAGTVPATAGLYYDEIENEIVTVGAAGEILSYTDCTLCGDYIITEDGDPITTEDGDPILTES